MAKFFQKLRSILPSGSEDPETRYFKVAVYSLVGLVVLMAIVGLTVFLVTIEGAEETLVPDVENKELVEALLLLQERGLYPEVRLQYHSNPTLKGFVISQDPSPGTAVKAGKRVDIAVSQGAIVDTVEDYRGWDLRDVEVRLRELSASYDAILRIGDIVYSFDESEPGTVLEQDPTPGTELLALTDLDLIVSRGPDLETFPVDTYVGLDFERAIDLLDRDNVAFTFAVRDAAEDEPQGVVVAQEPPPGEEISRETIVVLELTRPVLTDGEEEDEDTGAGETDEDEEQLDQVFGVFDVTLPDFAVAVEVRLDAIRPGGGVETIFTLNHPGGRLTVPFAEPPRTELVLYQADRQLRSLVVEAPEPIEEE